ncbi:LCP family protein [Lachnoclostridium phytofermentans]|uniref:LCP family protein n=1 Tax=Lachnoclostridium phytofermentans TaxID=66219 RepID=UPI000496CB0C|nr:LCP family protein [Lachnoclostridium phytofermentans]
MKDDDSNLIDRHSEEDEWSQCTLNITSGLETYDESMEDMKESLAKQVQSLDENSVDELTKQRRKKKLRRRLGIVIAAFGVFIAILIFTPLGKVILSNIVGEYLYDKLVFEDSGNNLGNYQKEGEKEVLNNLTEDKKEDKEIINILLIGLEEFDNAANTDTMIVASINTKDNTLKLLSFMRDLYIDIEGHSKDRLNSVYSKGGIQLLYDTIDSNFGVSLDGYLLVNFEAFEQIVDILGGVNVTLTKAEAEYLNYHNYISNPEYRNVVEGEQLMVGNQVLGYCRIRKVSTGTESNDFGRTQRQRNVLQSIVSKLKSKNIISLAFLLDDILSTVHITTDITKSDFKDYLTIGMDLNLDNIETLRIPMDGDYRNLKIPNGKYYKAVLEIKDLEKSKEIIKSFLNPGLKNNIQ